MPSHLREQVMGALKALLLLSDSPWSEPPWRTRVYRARTLPLEAAELPALLVYQSDEPGRYESGNTAIRLDLTVEIELVVRDVPADHRRPAVDTAMNAIDAEIWQRIESDMTLGGLAHRVQQVRRRWGKPQGEGAQDQASMILTIEISYRAGRPDPTQAG